jgi:hypothetical protein
MTDPPPFVVLEHLKIGPYETVRVCAVTGDEGVAHQVADAMSDAGMRVWLVDLAGTEGTPTIERYVGKPGAAFLYSHGVTPGAAGSGDALTELGG